MLGCAGRLRVGYDRVDVGVCASVDEGLVLRSGLRWIEIQPSSPPPLGERGALGVGRCQVEGGRSAGGTYPSCPCLGLCSRSGGFANCLAILPMVFQSSDNSVNFFIPTKTCPPGKFDKTPGTLYIPNFWC